MINADRTSAREPNISNDYRTIEILDALGIVFRNKCYLCEKKDTHPGVFDVEHFETQNEAGNKRYNWTNLFLACHICNGIKPRKTPTDGYLDVCNPDHDVESFISYGFDPLEYDTPIFSAIEQSKKTQNTVHLLKRLHFGHDKKTKYRTASLRDAIKRQAQSVISNIAKYKRAEEIQDQKTLNKEKVKLIKYFSKGSPFTMLIRSFGIEYNLHFLFDS
ncbi:MAG: hypothetical protein IPK35_04685 [Saprospiraceae bacterium]|jgi:hypothetical protein|nr:hypothetical protein [Saprospiraceae bacterium]